MDVHPTAIVLLQSLLFMLQSLKQAPAGMPAPSSRGRLCCRAGLTAPPYSHRWPSHPSTHPHMLLFSDDGRRTSKPSYSAWETTAEYSMAPCHSLPRPRRCPPPWCSRRGLVNVVLHVERLTAGSTAAHKEMPPYYAQNNDSST